MENRAGYFVKNLYDKMEYKSFKPATLPPYPPITIDEHMLNKLIEANKQLAILNSLSSYIPNISLYISMYVRKEALLSSQIEGTQCTLDDVLNPLIETNVNRDVEDVINYIKASEYGISRLQTLPMCSRLFKEIHAILLKGVRGDEKTPGEFRHSQNWIGGIGSNLSNATYIPPNPNDMMQAMSELEVFINNGDIIDTLVSAALFHYQFETIHPFLDGNGRLGRLLIILFLMERKVLNSPVLYISYYLKLNRIEYYDRMSEVRRTGNFEQWICFFLDAISVSAKQGIDDIYSLSALNKKDLDKLDGNETRQAKTLMALFSYIQSNPIIDIGKTAIALNLSYNTVSKAVSILEEKHILYQVNNTKRSRIYCYKEYLDILRQNT